MHSTAYEQADQITLKTAHQALCHQLRCCASEAWAHQAVCHQLLHSEIHTVQTAPKKGTSAHMLPSAAHIPIDMSQ